MSKRKRKMRGTVKKIIKPSIAEPEKAEIAIPEADDLYREIRIENVVTGKDGHNERLKPGTDVDVTIETDSDETGRHYAVDITASLMKREIPYRICCLTSRPTQNFVVKPSVGPHYLRHPTTVLRYLSIGGVQSSRENLHYPAHQGRHTAHLRSLSAQRSHPRLRP